MFDCGAEGSAAVFFLTSTTVAFLVSGMGIREAVLLALPLMLHPDVLLGLGREKLAGDGLCGRESTDVGVAVSSLVKSVKPMNLFMGPFCGVTTRPLVILFRSEA